MEKIVSSVKIAISVVSHGQIHLIADLLHDIETHCSALTIEVILTLNLPEELPFALSEFSFPIQVIRNPRPLGSGRVLIAPHLPGEAERRLLVHKRHEAQRPGRLEVFERAGQLEQGGNPGCIVVGTRAAADRIVMGTHHDDVPWLRGPGNLDLDVLDRDSHRLVALASRGVPQLAHRVADIAEHRGPAAQPPYVPVADVPGQHAHMPSQRLGHHALVSRQIRQKAAMRPARHGGHVPDRAGHYYEESDCEETPHALKASAVEAPG